MNEQEEHIFIHLGFSHRPTLHTMRSHNTNSFLATFDPSALHMKWPTAENNIDLPPKKAALLIAFTLCTGFIPRVWVCIYTQRQEKEVGYVRFGVYFCGMVQLGSLHVFFST